MCIFYGAVFYPMSIIDDLFKKLKLYGRPVVVQPYLGLAELKAIPDVLEASNSDYDLKI